MDDTENALKAMRSLVGLGCACSLAVNSLMLRFDFRHSAKGRAYLWIDPPWRLTLARVIVTGSADWPVWDGVEDKEMNQPLWEAWCALLDPLNHAVLADVSFGVGCSDLCLRFDSGHRIETFGSRSDGCWWYYRDRVTGAVFEAGRAGISHESGDPAVDE